MTPIDPTQSAVLQAALDYARSHAGGGHGGHRVGVKPAIDAQETGATSQAKPAGNASFASLIQTAREEELRQPENEEEASPDTQGRDQPGAHRQPEAGPFSADAKDELEGIDEGQAEISDQWHAMYPAAASEPADPASS